jgi:RNA polymerase sigma-70 factor, ECF subfamily
VDKPSRRRTAVKEDELAIELQALPLGASNEERDERRLGESDRELVAASQLRPSSFVALYDRYFDRVFGYVRLRVRDRAACEDATSQVFTNALARIGEFRGEGSFAAWLFSIARNAAVDVRRTGSRESVSDDALAVLPDPRPGPEERLLERERRERLTNLLARLRPDQQELLALRYGAGLSFNEISVLVGGEPGALRVRVHRILDELRRRYPDDERRPQ